MVAYRIIFSLGILNVLAGLTLYFSCRCVPTSGIGKGLMKRPWFQKFYKFHCYVWWIFGASVVAHGILAIILYGVPF